MISKEKWYILTRPQKFLRNVRDLDKLIVAKGFKKLPKVQKIARSGHTGYQSTNSSSLVDVKVLIFRFGVYKRQVKIINDFK